jgi:ParB family chromosome partitioning protein
MVKSKHWYNMHGGGHMARKNLLKGLMEEATSPAPSDEETRVDLAKPRYSSGAIGAVSQSISELKSRAVQEIDPRMVDDAGIKDRLDDPAGLDDLIASITEYGQQVPVLLRPNPIYPERYQVVYGRRRVAALKAMNQPVRALIRVLNDRDLIMAQGQENSARRDLSFIERVNFARQMQDMKYDRKVICDALHVDKTLISRMLAVADRVPEPLITAIGAAPSVGRDRWLKLAELLEGTALDDAISAAQGDTSDKRFDAVFAALSPSRPPPAPQSPGAVGGWGGGGVGGAEEGKG